MLILPIAPEQAEENTTEDNLEENFTLIEDHKVRHDTFTTTFNALREAVRSLLSRSGSCELNNSATVNFQDTTKQYGRRRRPINSRDTVPQSVDLVQPWI